MITQLHIRNFRSIKSSDLDLGKITVLTGPNNSGKSSFIYALLALKNIVNNPNQSIDNCLTLPFINLGGFKQTSFLKDENLNITLGITIKARTLEVSYDLLLNPRSSKIILSSKSPFSFKLEMEVAFPYPMNKYEECKINIGDSTLSFSWNGITANLEVLKDQPEAINSKITEIKKTILLPLIALSIIDFVPIRRGFTKPYFSPVPLQVQISTEDELATLLATDRDLAGKVAHYLEQIVDRHFSVYTIPGTANFYLQTRDKKNGFTSDLVNEGLGTNQLVTILSKVLQGNTKFVCIDEPEIHLHPSIINKLVAVIIEIAEKEKKQFLVSTHSEHFITSLLNAVAEKEINSEDVKVYHLTKDDKETKAEAQEINEKGQIEGGLKNFYASELENLKTLFKITD